MVRKLAVALLSLGLLSPSLANALGLGDIELKSHLSEPFHAEIKLLQVRDLTVQEVLPGLASKADFQNADVERSFFLTDLRFETIFKDDGTAVIKVTSRKPVREPFLNFLVEVHWPAGRLLREYTVLLDPPAFAEQGGAQSVAPSRATPSQPQQRQPAQPQQRRTQTIEQPRQQPAPSYGRRTDDTQPAAPESGQGEVYRTGSNDSLWSVAQKLKPSRDVTVQQTMIAIQRENPEAFIDDNINLMRSGQVLRVPPADQVRRITRQQAINEVARQNEAWKSKVAQRRQPSGQMEKPAIEGTGRTAQPPSEKEGGGQLRLVSGSDEGPAGARAGGGEGRASAGVESRLANLEEGLEKSKLENEQLKVKVNDLSEQLDTSEKLLNLKDDQIAALQAKLAELEAQRERLAQQEASAQDTTETAPGMAQAPGAEEELAEAPEEGMAPESEPELAGEDAPEETAPTEEGAAEEMTGETEDQMAMTEEDMAPEEEVDYNFAPEPEEEKPTTVDTSEEADVAATEPVEKPAQPEQKTAAPQPKPTGFLDQFLSNPLYIGGLVAILLAIAGALFLSRRKQAAEEDEYVAELEDDFQMEDFSEESVTDETPDFGDFGEGEAVAEDSASEEAAEKEEKDVLGEADIYIAYGRYGQAIEFLQKAIEDDPVRADYRLKLLEVFAEAGDRDGFAKAEDELTALGDDEANRKATELHEKLRSNASASASDDFSGLDLGDTEEGEDATAIMGGQEAAPESSASDEETMEFDLSADLPDAEDDTLTSGEAVPSLDDLESELAPSSDDELSLDDFEIPEAEAKEPEELESSFDTEPQEEELEPLEFELGEESEPAHDAGDETVVQKAQEPTGDAAASDFEIDADAAASIADELGDDLDLDLGDLDQPEEPKPVADEGAAAAEAPAEEEDMDFTLGDDAFDELAEPETPSETAEDTDDFSLDLDMEEPAEEPQSLQEDSGEALTEPEAESAVEETFESLSEGLEGLDEEPAVEEVQETQQPASDLETTETFLSGDEDDLGFLSDSDEIATKLDLARAYIDMGDRDGAKDILDEVMLEGNDDQQKDAKALMERVES